MAYGPRARHTPGTHDVQTRYRRGTRSCTSSVPRLYLLCTWSEPRGHLVVPPGAGFRVAGGPRKGSRKGSGPQYGDRRPRFEGCQCPMWFGRSSRLEPHRTPPVQVVGCHGLIQSTWESHRVCTGGARWPNRCGTGWRPKGVIRAEGLSASAPKRCLRDAQSGWGRGTNRRSAGGVMKGTGAHIRIFLRCWEKCAKVRP